MGTLKHGYARRGQKAPEFLAWKLMRARCSRASRPDFKHYGARGIRVCERWASFANFIADMGPRPTLQHTLDRIDNDGNYEPGNCRWATRAQQASNTRANRWVTFNGQRLTLTDWARRLGINPSTLSTRLKLWPLEQALTQASAAPGARS